MKEALKSGQEEKWASQVEYMLAWKRHALAQRAYLKSCVEMRRYEDFKKPWVRSQPELADLLVAAQGTIGRELAEIRELLRVCARAEGIMEDLNDDE